MFDADGAIIKTIEDNGLKILEDISVVGFDDVYLSQFLKPFLTTMGHPLYEEGKVVAEILLERMNGRTDDEPKRIVIKTNLIIGETVARRL